MICNLRLFSEVKIFPLSFFKNYYPSKSSWGFPTSRKGYFWFNTIRNISTHFIQCRFHFIRGNFCDAYSCSYQKGEKFLFYLKKCIKVGMKQQTKNEEILMLLKPNDREKVFFLGNICKVHNGDVHFGHNLAIYHNILATSLRLWQHVTCEFPCLTY